MTRVLAGEAPVILPAATGIDQIRADGPDLVITLPDGRVIIIENGAVQPPELVVGNVHVPPANLAALLIGREPEPAAGAPKSSGGNFAQDVAPLISAFKLGDLLDPTELGFTAQERRVFIADRIDNPVTIKILTPDQPAGAIAATAHVAESGLAARGSKPAGSDSAANTETTSGTIQIDAKDGPIKITINGQALESVGDTVQTHLGELLITKFTATEITYSYTLIDNTLDPAAGDIVTVVVTDADGDVGTATLTIAIDDDVPTARADAVSVAAADYDATSGNVITGTGTNDPAAGHDTLGADGAQVTSARSGSDGPNGAPGSEIAGQYGVLVIGSDGEFTYVRSPGTPGGVSDVFTYTLTDGDGDTSQAKLTFAIADSGVRILSVPDGADAQVSESGLPARGNEPAGSDSQSDSASTSGTIVFEAPDGPATVAINGVDVVAIGQVITTVTGILTITAIERDSIGYRFTLTDNVSGDFVSQEFTVRVTDRDGDSDSGTFVIAIVDDVPIAVDDVAAVAVDGARTALGNVITGSEDNGGADTPGADGAMVTAIAFDGANGAPGAAIAGAYGVLVMAADGAYRYTVDPANPLVGELAPGETATDIFTYTLTDGDGDQATATLTVTVTGGNDPVSITGLSGAGAEGVVDEAGLPNGSAPDAAMLTASGSFSVTALDGLAQLTIGGVKVFDGDPVSGVVLQTATGRLEITDVTAETGASGRVTGAIVSYTFTLTNNTTAHTGTADAVLRQSFGVVATDTDGSQAQQTIDIDIRDDVPTARAAAPISVVEDAAPIGGNLLADDTAGADGARLTAVVIDGTTVAISASETTTYVNSKGSYTFSAAGVWSFDPVSQDSATGVSAGFGYTITDGDGDRSTAAQAITITDGRGPAAGHDVRLVVDDQRLANGSTPAPDQPEHAVGTITFTPGSDAIASFAFGSEASLGGGLNWIRNSATSLTGWSGDHAVVRLTLVASGNNATVTATLLSNYNLHPDGSSDDLAELGTVRVIATDRDGDTASAQVSLGVSDDVPTIATTGFDAGALTVDESNLSIDAKADFGAILDIHYNADGPRQLLYSFDLGNVSGLIDVATGASVGLHYGADESSVIGYVLGSPSLVVFTLSIDDAGILTLDQQRAVRHPDGTNPDDTVSFARSAINVVATVTDGDGDQASVTVDLSGIAVFHDDGPRIQLSVNNQAAGSLTTHDALTIGPASDVATGGFAGAFVLSANSPGADGAGATAWTYALALGPSAAASGLTSNGVPIALTLAGGVVTGAAGGSPVFSIAVNAMSGAVTLTQFAELDHPLPGASSDYGSQLVSLANGLVLLRGSVAVTDRDGDTASGTAELDLGGKIAFADDGPTVTVSGNAPRLEVDETSFTANAQRDFSSLFAATLHYGADGPGSLTYKLGTAGPGAATGLIDSLTGEPVTLVLTSGAVVGQTATSGLEVLRITVSPDGLVTFDQSRAVVHSPDTGPDQALTLSGAGLVTLTATVTDRDGDHASATADITGSFAIRDDAPIATDDVDFVSRDGPAVADGNAIAGVGGVDVNTTDGTADVLSHDGGTHVAGFRFGTHEGTPGVLLQAAHGTFTIDANGFYRYQLDTADAAIIALAAGQTIKEEFSYTIEDSDGDRSTATITITIAGTNDMPVALADTNWVRDDVSGSDPTTSGNVLRDVPHPGAPSGTFADVRDTDPDNDTLSVANPDTYFGSYGTLILASDGSYTYYLNEDNQAVNALGVGQTLVETFAYTATDGSLSSASTLRITIFGTNDNPVIGTATARVSEEGTALGLPDTAPDPARDTTDSASASGTLAITDPDVGQTLVITFGDPGAVLTAGGVPVLWSGVGSGTLVGKAGGAEVIRATIDGAGHWTVTLLAGIDHPVAGVEDTLSIAIPVSVSDGIATVARSDALVVTIEDDQPVAFGESGSSAQPQQNVNALFVLDFSNSIDNGELNTMLTAVKAALNRLDAVTTDTLAIRFVIFSSGSFASPAFTTAADANVWLAALNPADGGVRPDTIGLNTNYTGAIQTALANYSAVAGASNQVFFISDGNPNQSVQFGGSPPHVVNSLTTSTATAWNTFVDTNHVNVTAIGINNDPLSPLNIQRLADVDLNDAPDNQPILINDFDALLGTLLNAVTPPNFAGNLTANDHFGADGGRLLSITVGTETYTWDGATSIALGSGGTLGGTSIAAHTPLGGTLLLDFATGQYSYQPPSPITVTATESFSYTIVDRDGDTASATLDVSLATSAPPVVLDLNGNGFEFLDASAGVRFDFNGDGKAESTAWVGPGDGILVIDLNGDGKVNGAAELVFAAGGLTDLQGLAASYDTNRDGVLDSRDAGFSLFQVWQDANSNGVTDPGELMSLSARGIVSLDLTGRGRSSTAAGGQVLIHAETAFSKADGSAGRLADVSFLTNMAQAQAQADTAALRGVTTVAAAVAFATQAATAVAAVAAAPTETAQPHLSAVAETTAATSGEQSFEVRGFGQELVPIAPLADHATVRDHHAPAAEELRPASENLVLPAQLLGGVIDLSHVDAAPAVAAVQNAAPGFASIQLAAAQAMPALAVRTAVDAVLNQHESDVIDRVIERFGTATVGRTDAQDPTSAQDRGQSPGDSHPANAAPAALAAGPATGAGETAVAYLGAQSGGHPDHGHFAFNLAANGLSLQALSDHHIAMQLEAVAAAG